MASTQPWFSTLVYKEKLQSSGIPRLNSELIQECHQVREFDETGRRWSASHYPGGYTSYSSMNELHRFSSTFAALERKITRHVRRFAEALDMDLVGRKVYMTDLWVNIMPESVSHPLHLHPLSFISGTYYVQTPVGCPGTKFEDPRLDRFMAAPPRRGSARESNQTFVTYKAEAGYVILFESWLRHEVPSNTSSAERISLSFNYAWE